MSTSAEAASEQTIDAALRFLGNVAKSGSTSNESSSKVVAFAMCSNHRLRAAAIPALVQLTGRPAQLALVALLRDPNPSIQAEAVDTVGKLKINDAIPPLIELLEHDSDEVVLRAAAALARMDNREGLQPVLRLLRQDHENTRLAALALGLIVGQRFRLNQQGVKQARLYAKRNRLHKQK